MTNSPLPLLTFGVVAYNQESFIAAAVTSALAQTYGNLEILLSDDCSGDSTFQVMESLAKVYRGPHRIVLNRNRERLGLCAHVNRAVELSHGALFIVAAGDDISHPERSDRIFSAWNATQRKAHSVYSAYSTIDAAGNPIPQITSRKPATVPEPSHELLTVTPLDYVRQKSIAISGCSHAFSPKLFELFGALPANIVCEDMALGFRSVLLGPILRLAEPLVQYRRHDSNISAGHLRSTDPAALNHAEQMLRRRLQRLEDVCQSFRADVSSASSHGIISHTTGRHLANAITQTQECYQIRRRLIGAHGWEALKLLAMLQLRGGSPRVVGENLLRILPKVVYQYWRVRRAQFA